MPESLTACMAAADGELDVAAGEVESLGPIVMVAQIEVLHFGGELRGKVGRIEMSDGADAVGAALQRLPHRFDIIAHGSDATESRYDDAPSHD